MPLLKLPNGDFFKVPQGTSRDEAIALARQRFPFLYEDQSFGGRMSRAVRSGIDALLESGEGIVAGTRSLVGDKEGTQADIERIRADQRAEAGGPQALSVSQLGDIYKMQGLGALIKNIPGYIGEQVLSNAPSMAVPLAAGAAAGAVSGPFAPIVGPLAGMATYGLQTFGQNVQRQIGEGRNADDLAAGKALGTAAVTAPLGYLVDRFVVGLGKIGSTEKIGEALMREIAARGVGKTAAKGALAGLAEVPTEVLEQAAERYQAGLPLFDDKAKQEYIETAAGALAVGTVAGVGSHLVDRSKAKSGIEEFDANKARAEAFTRTQAEEKEKQAKAAADEQKAFQKQSGQLFEGAGSALPITQKPEELIAAIQAAEAAGNTQQASILRDQYRQITEPEPAAPAEEPGPLSPSRLIPQRDALAEQIQLVDNQLVALRKRFEETQDQSFKDQADGLLKRREQFNTALSSIEELISKTPGTRPIEELNREIEKLAKQAKAAEEKGDHAKALDLTAKAVELKRTRDAQQPSSGDLFAGVPSLAEGNEQRAQEAKAAEEQGKAEQRGLFDKAADDAAVDMGVYHVEEKLRQPPPPAVQAGIDSGNLSQPVQKWLGLPVVAPLSVERNAPTVLRQVEERIATLEDQRKNEFPSKEVITEAGTLTPAGRKLAAVEAQLVELRRLKKLAEDALKPNIDEALVEKLVAAAGRKQEGEINIPERSPQERQRRVEKIGKVADGIFMQLTDRLDSIRKGETLGGINPAAASSTTATEQERARGEVERYVNALKAKAAYERSLNGAEPLTHEEAEKAFAPVRDNLLHLVDRSSAQRFRKTPAYQRYEKAIASKLADLDEQANPLLKKLEALRKAREASAAPDKIGAEEATITRQLRRVLTERKQLEKPFREKELKRGFSRQEFNELKTAHAKVLRDVVRPKAKAQAAPFSLTAVRPEDLAAQERQEAPKKVSLPAELTQARDKLSTSIESTLASRPDTPKPVKVVLERVIDALPRAPRSLMDEAEALRRRVEFGQPVYATDLRSLNEELKAAQAARESLTEGGQKELFPEKQNTAIVRSTPAAFQKFLQSAGVAKLRASLTGAGLRRLYDTRTYLNLERADIERRQKALQAKAAEGSKVTSKAYEESLAQLRQALAQGDLTLDEVQQEWEAHAQRMQELSKVGSASRQAEVARVTENLTANLDTQLNRLAETITAVEKASKAVRSRAPDMRTPVEKETAAVAARLKKIQNLRALNEQAIAREKARAEQDRLEQAKIAGLKKAPAAVAPNREEVERAREGVERKEAKANRVSFEQASKELARIEKRLELGAGKLGERARENLEIRREQLQGQLAALSTLLRRSRPGPGKIGVVYANEQRPKAGRPLIDASRSAARGSIDRTVAERIDPKVVDALKEDARAMAQQRMLNEGLATAKTVKTATGPKKVITPADTAIYNQYVEEYHQQLLTERAKATQAKALKSLFETDTAFRTSDGESGVNPEAAKAVSDRITGKLPEGVNVTYAATNADIPQDFRDEIARKGLTPQDVKGMVLPDGRVLVVGENHASTQSLEETFAHELIGHYGVDGVVGPEGMKALTDKLFARGWEHVAKLAEALGVHSEVSSTLDLALKQGLSDDQRQLAMVRELIAHAAEGRKVKAGAVEQVKQFIRDVIDAVRGWFKSIGADSLVAKDAREIQQLIKQAHTDLEATRPGVYVGASGEPVFRMTQAKLPPEMAPMGGALDKLIVKQQTIRDRVKSDALGLSAKTWFVDRLAPFEKIASMMDDANAAGQMMYYLQKHSDMLTMATSAARFGPLDLVKKGEGVYSVEAGHGPSLTSVDAALKPLTKMGFNAEGATRTFTAYMAALRAQSVGWDALNFDKATQAELQKIMPTINARPEIRSVLDHARAEYNAYNRGLVNFVEKSGAISKELAAKMRAENDYIPFYREEHGNIVLELGGTTPIRIGNIKDQPYLHRLVGGNQPIMDFTASSMQNTMLLTDMALRNLAVKNTGFTLQKLGVAKIGRGAGPQAGNVIRFKDGGVDKFATIDTAGTAFEGIPTELLAKSIEGVSMVIPEWLKLMALPARLLRKGVTLNPLYPYLQLLKDSMSVGATRGHSYSNVINALDGVKSFVKNDALKLQHKGVISGQLFSGTTDDVATMRRQVISGEGALHKWMAWQEAQAIRADGAVRAMVYNDALKRGMNERDAEYAAIQAMPYSRRGLSPGLRYISMMVPFFNAQIVALNALYNSLRGRVPGNTRSMIQKKLFGAGMMMAMSTMVYAAMVGDEEWYKNMPLETRLRNWLIKLPGMDAPLAIPIPFEFGVMFKAFAEATALGMFNDTPEGKLVWDAMRKLVLQSVPGGTIPMDSVPVLKAIPAGPLAATAIQPLIEVAANKSFFSDSPIENERERKLDPEERYRENTSELAKLGGQIFGQSPLVLDHLLRGYTGPMGTALAALVGTATGPVPKSMGASPEQDITRMPLVSQLFKNPEGGAAIEAAIDMLAEAERHANTYKKLEQEGRDADAEAYAKKYEADIDRGDLAGKLRQKLGEYSKQAREIRADASMSATDKRAALKELRREQIDVARDFIQQLR